MDLAGVALPQLTRRLGEQLLAQGWRVATAESCTGGGIAAAITAVAGSSAWFEYGIVSYANSAKEKLLQVNPQTLREQGAVSQAVVEQMAAGALALSGANIVVAVSGVAGPAGGSAEKPVGTVWLAWALASGAMRSECFQFAGDRAAVQAQAVVQGVRGLLKLL
jgi:nicotinamide-nucleotide amidase